MEETVLQRIRKVIDYLNISDRKFAESIGLPQTTVSSMFKRGNDPNVNIIQAIVNAHTFISSDWLLTGKGEMFVPKEKSFNTAAERFKMIRQSLELTVPEIAKILGVATSTIEGIENESIQINNLIKQKINAIFDVDPLYLDGHTEKVYLSSGGFMRARKIAQDCKQKNDKEVTINNIIESCADTRPRIPYTAAAGSLTNAVEGVTAEQCEQIPRITAFPNYDFTIIIKGNSMEPKYEGGDEVACKRVDSTSFIQWGKVHVMDTAQGIVIKRVYEDGDKIRCVSYNPEYPDFSIQKDEIYSMSLIVGLLRL